MIQDRIGSHLAGHDDLPHAQQPSTASEAAAAPSILPSQAGTQLSMREPLLSSSDDCPFWAVLTPRAIGETQSDGGVTASSLSAPGTPL